MDADVIDVPTAISRCANVIDDPSQLRIELSPLERSAHPHARFACALFELDLARRGDKTARAVLANIADELLVYWHDGVGSALASAYPALEELWMNAASMLIGFEMRRFQLALDACATAIGNPEQLAEAVSQLQPSGNRRVEFARCLYHLELCRRGVTSSRTEFEQRVPLIVDAYCGEASADEFIGSDSTLRRLWEALKPTVAQFYEGDTKTSQPLDDDLQLSSIPTDPQLDAFDGDRRRPVPGFHELVRSSAPTPYPTPTITDRSIVGAGPTDPAIAFPPDADDLQQQQRSTRTKKALQNANADDAVRTLEMEISEDLLNEVTSPPPPPDNLTPPGSWFPPSPPGSSGEFEVFEAGQTPPYALRPIDLRSPPASPQKSTPSPVPGREVFDEVVHPPDADTAAFWNHTFSSLELLPGQLETNGRLLSTETRAQRKQLTDYVDSLSAYASVPEANAFACLMQLALASQMKERNLFGQPNLKRIEMLSAALSRLAPTPDAAARAAVWYILDGVATQAELQRGLELLARFLAWCLRHKIDPLAPEAAPRFASDIS